MAKSFVLHDESVNSYGFRMLTSGANLDEFRKNPVMLLNHNDFSLPIGRWENIRVEGSKILADPVFNMKDAGAARIAQMVEDDFIRMASIGAWPPEEKSDADYLRLPGQTLPTITKWTVREASIVTIGSNHNALAFYDRETKERIDLTDKNNLIRLMDNNNHKKDFKMSLLTGILKLHDNASEAEMFTVVQGIIANNDRLKLENQTLTEAIDAQKAQRVQEQKQEAISLADAAIKDGRYDATGRDALLALFDKDFDGTKSMLAAIPTRGSVTAQIRAGKQTVDLGDWKNKSWEELDKAGMLVELKDNHPDVYKEKFKTRFGVEPKL